MRDVYVETEELTVPLRFAMIASRVAAVLKGVQKGRRLDEKGKRSLLAAADMLDRAAKGGTVLRDKSMAGYSAEAMSAYRLVHDTKLPGGDGHNPSELVRRLNEMAGMLRGLAATEPLKGKRQIGKLQEFFSFLTRRSLDESVGSAEVVQFG